MQTQQKQKILGGLAAAMAEPGRSRFAAESISKEMAKT